MRAHAVAYWPATTAAAPAAERPPAAMPAAGQETSPKTEEAKAEPKARAKAKAKAEAFASAFRGVDVSVIPHGIGQSARAHLEPLGAKVLKPWQFQGLHVRWCRWQ